MKPLQAMEKIVILFLVIALLPVASGRKIQLCSGAKTLDCDSKIIEISALRYFGTCESKGRDSCSLTRIINFSSTDAVQCHPFNLLIYQNCHLRQDCIINWSDLYDRKDFDYPFACFISLELISVVIDFKCVDNLETAVRFDQNRCNQSTSQPLTSFTSTYSTSRARASTTAITTNSDANFATSTQSTTSTGNHRPIGNGVTNFSLEELNKTKFLFTMTRFTEDRTTITSPGNYSGSSDQLAKVPNSSQNDVILIATGTGGVVLVLLLIIILVVVTRRFKKRTSKKMPKEGLSPSVAVNAISHPGYGAHLSLDVYAKNKGDKDLYYSDLKDATFGELCQICLDRGHTDCQGHSAMRKSASANSSRSNLTFLDSGLYQHVTEQYHSHPDIHVYTKLDDEIIEPDRLVLSASDNPAFAVFDFELGGSAAAPEDGVYNVLENRKYEQSSPEFSIDTGSEGSTKPLTYDPSDDYSVPAETHLYEELPCPAQRQLPPLPSASSAVTMKD